MEPSTSHGSPPDADIAVVSQALAGLILGPGSEDADRSDADGDLDGSGAGGRDGRDGGGRGADGGRGGERPGEPEDKEQILGAVVVDRDLRIVSANLGPRCFDGLTAVPGEPFVNLLPSADVPAVTQRLRRAVETREPHVARVQRLPKPDGSELVVSLSILPSPQPDDGLTISFIDMARRFHLYAAATSIGTTLDVGDTARALAGSLLPWGDVVAVSLDDNVWTGEQVEGRTTLRRAALAPDHDWPAGFLTPGQVLPREADVLLGRAGHRDDDGTVVLPDRAAVEQALGADPGLLRALVPGDGPLCVACVPLIVEDVDGPHGDAPMVLGVAEVWRRPDGPLGPFGADLIDMRELVSKTAKHVDNARRHQREHAQVLALQRRLLPPSPTDTIEIAKAYRLTTPDSAGVGGDWVSSFSLPGGRTALVVGDVVGHGLGAAAAMGRLSMEAQAHLSAGMAPDEVLARLDETVALLDDTEAGFAAGYSALNSTCCVVSYDPVENRCVMSSAGHLPPIVVHPDGRAEVIAARTQSGLGTSFLTREPFEVHEFAAEPGALLALYTDGLIEDPSTPIDRGIAELGRELARIRPGDDLQEAVDRTIRGLAPARGKQRDDVTLMLARMAGRPGRDVATWSLPARDPRGAARARRLVARQLHSWGLEERVHDTVLVVSELVANAVRHGAGEITLRLIRTGGSRLVCEVGDRSDARPRRRRAGSTDESGRGLLVVHKLTDRWGVRWCDGGGKTTWAEVAA
ncbi:SpoIIE family protein phosphatase [Streptomyces sp. V4-01]|uniref:SpoIIE family protein phosphatase n=1 Tax=Actinacidiphila polyblastidii TaxID=3110430 RepID=A0ABU7P9K8_9ACTN|nr:SpoIIE family protein phosphatase [Streptomyces sp. V4-01]